MRRQAQSNRKEHGTCELKSSATTTWPASSRANSSSRNLNDLGLTPKSKPWRRNERPRASAHRRSSPNETRVQCYGSASSRIIRNPLIANVTYNRCVYLGQTDIALNSRATYEAHSPVWCREFGQLAGRSDSTAWAIDIDEFHLRYRFGHETRSQSARRPCRQTFHILENFPDGE
jgi:hypothetical protein